MRVLLATDGSRDARAAAAFVGHLPLTARARVRIVSVVEHRPVPYELREVPGYDDALLAHARRIVEEARAALSVPVTVETAVIEGVAREAIVGEALDWEADLVAVGARGLNMVSALLLGSVSLAVARRAEGAVLVVKGEPTRLGRVLVGLDGSDAALHAARSVAAWPLDARHAVELVGVVEPVHFPSSAPAVIHPQIAAAIREMKEERRAELTKAIDQVAPLFEAHGVSVSRSTPEGHPAQVLVDTAGEIGADLIVVGARGLGGVKRLLLGSVSENVLRAASGPVLIVKRPSTSAQ